MKIQVVIPSSILHGLIRKRKYAKSTKADMLYSYGIQ